MNFFALQIENMTDIDKTQFVYHSAKTSATAETGT